MIYFAQATDGGPVKIGTSADVDTRLHQLEQHYGKPLALLATLPGGREEEARIHARFAHLRLGRTEQFLPNRELMSFLGRPLLVSANPGVVEVMKGTNSRIRDVCLFLRGTQEWKAWVERLGRADRAASINELGDRALVVYARHIGFSEVPPKR